MTKQVNTANRLAKAAKRAAIGLYNGCVVGPVKPNMIDTVTEITPDWLTAHPIAARKVAYRVSATLGRKLSRTLAV
jgi:hypothetical protein